MYKFHIILITAVLVLVAGALAQEDPADSTAAPADTAAGPDSTEASAPADSASASDSTEASAPADSASASDSTEASGPADSASASDSTEASGPADSASASDSTEASAPADSVTAPDSVEAAAPIDSTVPVRRRKKYTMYFHPLSLFPRESDNGSLFPGGLWLTHERTLRQKDRAMIARVGYALDHTTDFSSDDFGDIELTARGLDLQLGLRQYGQKPLDMAFLEFMASVKVFDHDYRAYRDGEFIDNGRTSAVCLGALGYVGLKKVFENYVCYLSLGAGYGYVIPADQSLLLEYGGEEKTIEPEGGTVLIDFNLGIGYSY